MQLYTVNINKKETSTPISIRKLINYKANQATRNVWRIGLGYLLLMHDSYSSLLLVITWHKWRELSISTSLWWPSCVIVIIPAFLFFFFARVFSIVTYFIYFCLLHLDRRRSTVDEARSQSKLQLFISNRSSLTDQVMLILNRVGSNCFVCRVPFIIFPFIYSH